MASTARIERWPQTDDELWEFINTVWGLRMSRRSVCEEHSSPFSAFADAYFARNNVAVWWASRGLGGKSMTLAHLALTEAIALKASVTVLGGSGEQSTNVLNYITKAWDRPHAPKSLLIGDPARREVKLTYGNTVRALMASQTSVRGPHPERLRLDEADEMEIPLFTASLGQPIARPPIKSQTVIASTRQYAGGTMDYVLAESAKKGWPVYRWCYRENLLPHGWLSVEELNNTKNRIPEAMWEAEYELQEPSSDSRAINTECVIRSFDKTLGIYAGEPDEYLEFEPPILGETYYTGADWAKDKDWTIITTWRALNENTWKRVAWERMARKPWPLMVSRFNHRVFRYPGKSAHDITGAGKVIDDYLIIPGFQANMGVWLQGRIRSEVFTSYIARMERNGFVGPEIAYCLGEHKFAKNADLYTTAGHPPDSIVADALAWFSRDLDSTFATTSSILVRPIDRTTPTEYRDPRYD